MKTMKLPLAAACVLAAAVLFADPERVGLRSTAHAQQRTFDAWLEDFRSAALTAGISPATVDASLAGLTPLEQVIERDRAQPEFTLDFRGYLTRLVSQSRIEEGQRMLAEHSELLQKVGKRYGMPPELLAAGRRGSYGRTGRLLGGSGDCDAGLRRPARPGIPEPVLPCGSRSGHVELAR
jgi:membrane-bound lytic murein transglycosylase B